MTIARPTRLSPCATARPPASRATMRRSPTLTVAAAPRTLAIRVRQAAAARPEGLELGTQTRVRSEQGDGEIDGRAAPSRCGAKRTAGARFARARPASRMIPCARRRPPFHVVSGFRACC
jgi:hypothetical protein